MEWPHSFCVIFGGGVRLDALSPLANQEPALGQVVEDSSGIYLLPNLDMSHEKFPYDQVLEYG